MRAELAGGGGGRACRGQIGQLGHLRVLPCQDPDLEARRKAELAKIKQKNRRFKEKVEQVLRRQKAGGASRRGRPPRAPPGAHSAPAPSQGRA